MSANLKSLSKQEKFKQAEKHLQKYLSEIKRHVDFSDFQIVNLLDKASKKYRKINNSRIKLMFLNIFLK